MSTGAWHLGPHAGADGGSKVRHAFVFGDFRRVRRAGLIARVYRAAAWRHKSGELAARDLPRWGRSPKRCAHRQRTRVRSEAGVCGGHAAGYGRGRRGRSSTYVDTDGSPVRDEAIVDRLRSLVVPPG